MFRTLQPIVLALVAAMIVPGAARAEAPFPGYDDVCGFRIVVQPTPTVSQAVVTVSGEALVLLDPSLDNPLEEARRRFLIAHECAHHVLGHTQDSALRQRRASRRAVRDHEMSADCWAAEQLSRAGLKGIVTMMSNRFHRAGLYSPGGGYPSGIQRATIILHCATNR